jgi:hypothetical protein
VNDAVLSLALSLKCIDGNDVAAQASRTEVNDAFARLSKKIEQ